MFAVLLTGPPGAGKTSVPALQGVDLVLSTEGKRPEAVAERIRAARPDQLAPGCHA